jgi:hypothetical protein
MVDRFARGGDLLSPDAVFEPDRAAGAHAAMEAGSVIGKIVQKP